MKEYLDKFNSLKYRIDSGHTLKIEKVCHMFFFLKNLKIVFEI